MSLTSPAQVQVHSPAAAVRRWTARSWPELNNPAAWIVALIMLIMPLIANGFFLIEIFGTTLILGTIGLSLMFLAGYGGMVSLMQLTIAGFAGYMYAIFGVSGHPNISMGWPWWLATPMSLALATIFGTLGGALAVRTAGIYTIMITLAIPSAFHFFILRTFALDFLVKIGLDGNRFRLLSGLGFLAVVFWSSDGMIGLWERWQRRNRSGAMQAKGTPGHG